MFRFFARRLNDSLRPAVAPSANYLVQPLAALMGICFGALTDKEHADMLDECYVQTKRLISTSDALKASGVRHSPIRWPRGINSVVVPAISRMSRGHYRARVHSSWSVVWEAGSRRSWRLRADECRPSRTPVHGCFSTWT